ncbi:unnamed protein product [Amoebophrya sp. A120]|nr:unnamed protein product [Amoebophrya sp. A120]|eukprot:GSA120T00012088001.1
MTLLRRRAGGPDLLGPLTHAGRGSQPKWARRRPRRAPAFLLLACRRAQVAAWLRPGCAEGVCDFAFACGSEVQRDPPLAAVYSYAVSGWPLSQTRRHPAQE